MSELIDNFKVQDATPEKLSFQEELTGLDNLVKEYEKNAQNMDPELRQPTRRNIDEKIEAFVFARLKEKMLAGTAHEFIKPLLERVEVIDKKIET